MDSDKYLEGQSMQRPPLFESGSFIYWKNRFETYVKSKDLDLWHVITNGDFQPIQQNPKTKLGEVIPFEKQIDDLKKRHAKNNEAKMIIYNALSRKEYERIFMCNMAKEIWKTLLITHQGNSQVKDNKIDLLVQQYEQFVISKDESIDSAFTRFNTIITSLKALDECYSSKNYVRKFLRALHPKLRAKVTAIDESKDLTSLSLNELIGNLKVHKMIIKKDSEVVKAKVERKSLALKAKKESSDEECSTFEVKTKNTPWRCGDPNHLIGECPKPPKDKNRRAFVGGSWSDSGEEDDEKVNNETCLVAQASRNKPKDKICLATIDENFTLWHRRLGHTNMRLIQSLASKESRNHPLENVIGNLNQRTLSSQAQNQSNFFCFISTIEPNNVNEALGDESWIVFMQEELNQFIANDVWELVSQPRNMTITGTKWVFRNKLDENGIVSQNKARLVAQGYNQQKSIDYDETYALVSRLESIRILLSYACTLDFRLFQMDVKIAFLNGFINEEVYVAQPPGFIDFEKPDHVYKLKKALYGLKQAPKACQATRNKNKKTVVVDENEFLTREIQPHMKPWVDIIRENAICLGGHKDHVFACICHMLYCIESSTPYNLAFFVLKRMEKTRNKHKELFPYGMLLSRLFKHGVSVFPELAIDRYISFDRVMHPLAPHYERKTRSDHVKKRPRESNASSSSSTTLNHPSSSHPLDGTLDENDDE
uniref:Retrovirus-related Pol polyprotein from transposon TNT 1-94 n=1 Tax=Tanacetum cinerariifolium TaxID=118510 RepID=A0A6L2LZ31_TANCI|nr:retrovirus-related Pol polyprotein from transposon TNT 1-94 [Tanacetum cinerariifolium]